MLNNKTIAVVVPAYNEEKQISMVIETMPDFVDRIIIVNDCSKDKTAEIVKEYIQNDDKEIFLIENLENRVKWDKYSHADFIMQGVNKEELKYFTPSEIYNKNPEKSRIILINNLKNAGVGASIARGYKWCKDYGIYCTAVMAGDAQMDPSELEDICKPVIEDNIDYVKGNRLIHRSALLVIPKKRYIGNSILSILTKLASGYWHVSDTQTGFTAISNKAINSIRLHKIYKRYGMPNDMLVKLNIAFCTLKEVEIKPVYYVGEQSKMKLHKVIPRIALLLFKSFFKRLWIKYLFRDFHPLFLLYNFSFFLGIIDLHYIYKVVKLTIEGINVGFGPLFALSFLTISSFQSLLFAMWMDIQDNERLYK
jgi:glycosyltransferase involved in cell wall biosynthesis